MVSASKGARPGLEARAQYDALMESVAPRGDVTFETDTLGGVPGLWYIRRVGGQAKRSSTCTVVVQLWLRQGVPPSGRADRRASGSEGLYPGLSACSRTSISGCHGRRAGMLPRTCRAGRAPDCAHRRLRGRQSGPRTRVSSNATLVGVAVVSPVTDLTLSGASYETRADADPCLLVRRSRNSCMPTWGAPTRDNHWLRPFTVDTPACLPSAFTSVTTRCCWTTRSAMWSVRLPQASMPELMCGWGCHMGFPRASED